jgi:hypothetical protein
MTPGAAGDPAWTKFRCNNRSLAAVCRLVATPQMVIGLPVGSRILLTLTPY